MCDLCSLPCRNFDWWSVSFRLSAVFNTNTNQTVIQTYNETTYNSCNTDDALDSDTFQYNGGENEFGSSMTIAVPLTINRTQYYLSDSDDGEQCQQGMAFTINVSYGLGLPPSLNHPPPPAYVQPPTSSPDEELPPPGTAVNTPPSNDAVMATSARLCASVLLVLLSLVAWSSRYREFEILEFREFWITLFFCLNTHRKRGRWWTLVSLLIFYWHIVSFFCLNWEISFGSYSISIIIY